MRSIFIVLLIAVLIYGRRTKVKKGIRIYKQGTSKKDQDLLISVSRDDEFGIELHSNPTTGYEWFLEDYNKLTVLSTNTTDGLGLFVSPEVDEEIMGAPGTQRFFFKVTKAGEEILQFIYKRKWETQPSTSYKVLIMCK